MHAIMLLLYIDPEAGSMFCDTIFYKGYYIESNISENEPRVGVLSVNLATMLCNHAS